MKTVTSVTRFLSRQPIARPPASNSIAWSTSMWPDSTRMPMSGNSSRIRRAASRPSVLKVGGIPMSTITSCGRRSRGQRQQFGGIARLAGNDEAGPIEQACQSLPKQDVVIGNDHPQLTDRVLLAPPPSAQRRFSHRRRKR